MRIKQLTILACVVAFGLSVSGCTKCGFFWEDGQRACHSEAPR